MKVGLPNFHSHGKVLLPISALILAVAGVLGTSGKIWADRADMTKLWFATRKTPA